MSGGFVPYHLRQNKSVERAVFIDLLSRVGRSTAVPIHKFTYVGFAGPFSEDFKLIHQHLGLAKMISVEAEDVVHRRQKWNAPIRCISYKKCSARDYIDAFDGSSPTIAWLDYAEASKVGDQIAEAEFLLQKMAPYDVLKLTVNANHLSLGEANNLQRRLDRAKHRFGAFLPTPPVIDPDDIDRKGYPRFVLKAIETACKRAMAGKKGHVFQPLAAFVYSDSMHQMLTATGIVLPVDKTSAFLKETGLNKWPLATTDWGNGVTDPIEIGIPEMSVRERLFIDQLMPKTKSRSVLRRMGFGLAEGTEDRSIEALESYRRFYRHYPYFSKVIV
ncbi:hypothetical protein DFR24_3245 [Panacagrimonas perspica]|uniref:Uncharacterized protein n=1 Tax=Panacagrimonas perspica TaxID=381431 RepID=A0A4R7P501_9GAMM|nr:O-methyltransferase [Panacagrimonas perspica]TDU28865.1 hypothetical protein DFR24_3245 [Panacagrimonas perspica]THD02306.1 hypothetical protein B1810_15380 [Panacagrimonas perspica]